MMQTQAVASTQRTKPQSSSLPPYIEQALRIRAFELQLINLFKAGKLSGTVHTCVGQELCATALHPHLRKGVDAFFATHRGHGHYLAYGGPEDRLLAELMGREGALCLGRGGTQNLLYQRFFSSGIQGGSAPIAVGYAWALRQRKENAVAVCQIGDGTLGEGTLYEALTFAAWLKVPMLFLLEFNGWAQSTDVRRTTPGDLLQRVAGFGLEADWRSDENPSALHAHLGRVVAQVRQGNPFVQIIETRRLLAHSKGDDNRPGELLQTLWSQDPLARLLKQDATARTLYREAEENLERMATEVWERPALVPDCPSAFPPSSRACTSLALHADNGQNRTYGRVVEELNDTLHELMSEHPELFLIGEDLLDPYGGAFKVSRGLSTQFPEQVLSTPIAEAAIVGFSNGAALAGLRPVPELMFADFATLASDQLINFASKFHYMYGGQVTCPLLLRLVSGGRRGYGPTHSQSLEHLFYGVPGLRVLALSQRHDPRYLLTHAILNDDAPKVFVENKLLYALRPTEKPPVDLQIAPARGGVGSYPPLCYVPASGRKPDVTLVTYSGSTGLVESAMCRLIVEQELSFEYVVLTQLWPLDATDVLASVQRTQRLVIVEETEPQFGVGAALIAAVAQGLPGGFACRAVGALPIPIPSARHLEDQTLPSVGAVIKAILEIL
jgi:2-oxoisovalerate dehydrogenase E1 component